MLIEPQTHWEYAMELMPTEIGATNGTPGAHLVTDVQTLTMDLKPFLKLKIGMLFEIAKIQVNAFYQWHLSIFHLNRNVRDFVFERKDQIKFFNTIHSYSQLVLLPWGNTYDAAPGIEKMQALADKANEALFAVHGTQFDVG